MARRRGTSGINALLGIDKPAGMSSHDVVNAVRRAFDERRVGHAGTLDPLATGVMVVGVGQATRLLGLVTADSKRYLSRFSFGRETVTDDAEGETRVSAPAPERVGDVAFARASMGILRAMTSQTPPSYSAISVGGRRAYAMARDGEQVTLAERPISVTEAEVIAVGVDDKTGEPYWDVVTRVSKGTYVRALARDLGRALGSAAYVSDLRRVESGTVTMGMCLTLERLADLRASSAPIPWLDPLATLQMPGVELGYDDIRRVINGSSVRVREAGHDAPEDAPVGITHDGRLYAVARRHDDELAPQTVFVDGIEGVAKGDMHD